MSNLKQVLGSKRRKFMLAGNKTKLNIMETKYNYYRVIQQNTGSGWDDVSHYPTKSDYVITEKSGSFRTTASGRKIEISLLAHDLKEYRLMGYPTRVINRKELKCTN